MFLDNGTLPPGIHYMTWQEFYNKFSFSPKRKDLLEGLERAMKILKQCGCTVLYIDGSFVTEKLEPNDYDACWEGDPKTVPINIMIIEPVFLELRHPRNSQKNKYKGEIFPSYLNAEKGITYLDFFQQIRFTTDKKGIVAIKL